MAFDYGRARIGVAVGQTLTGTAQPIATVKCHVDGPDWQRLDQLLAEWRPGHLLVGNPMHLNGDSSSIGDAAKHFGEALADRYQLSVSWHDERLSSRAANDRFVEARQRGQARAKKAASLDAVAASIILESWLSGATQHPAETESVR